MLHSPIRTACLLLAAALAAAPAPAAVQGVQAAANMTEEVEEPGTTNEQRGEILVRAARQVATVELVLPWAQQNPGPVAAAVVRAHRELAEATQEMSETVDQPLRFEAARRRYDEAVTRFQATLAAPANATQAAQMQALPEARALSAGAADPIVALGAPQPGPHTLVKDVIFSLGYAFTSGRDGRDDVHDVSVSSNLLGTAAATVIDALGSQDLSSYFKNNVTVGAGFALGEGTRISGALGFGLGGFEVAGRSVWPVVNIEQVDTADGRIPREVVLLRPAESTWSNVALTLGVIPYSQESFKRKVEKGQVAPVVVVGITLPFYYPSNPAQTLAAMFTDDRSKFERQGKVGFVLGASLPLLRLDRQPKEE